MRIITVSIGSFGDLYPFIGISKRLIERGHEVVFLSCDYYEETIKKIGAKFVSIDTVESFNNALKVIDARDVQNSMPKQLDYMMINPMKKIVDAIEKENQPDNTVVLSWSLMVGARIATEKLGIPFVTLNSHPFAFRSLKEVRQASDKFLPNWFPKFLIRAGYKAVDTFVDSLVAERINNYRKELDLKPVSKIMQWGDSPDKIIGIFPDWFGKKQKDFPPQTELTTFPLFTDSKKAEKHEALEKFLTAGKKPVVFTPGSQFSKALEFFTNAAEACKSIGERAILITKYPEQIPDNLGQDIMHIEYADFNELLPKTSLLVHHGGIGTLAQAFKAGIPQIIIPWAFDQFDNAYRIKKMQVGDHIPEKMINPAYIAKKLKNLLGSKSVQKNCKDYAEKIKNTDPLDGTCNIIEKMIQKK